MNKLGIILISCFLIFKSSSAQIYSSDPQIFVTELINDAISKLSDKNIGIEEKKTMRFLVDWVLNPESYQLSRFSLHSTFTRVCYFTWWGNS